MVETSDRFTDIQLNIKLVKDSEWKLDLDLFMVVKKKYEKDQDACVNLLASYLRPFDYYFHPTYDGIVIATHYTG